ncbi:MAG: hypothetical protein LC774_01845, partial [Acidobacteria bacterium]|nr:hypothetical protein [Acidobacteriota bacterium]
AKATAVKTSVRRERIFSLLLEEPTLLGESETNDEVGTMNDELKAMLLLHRSTFLLHHCS